MRWVIVVLLMVSALSPGGFAQNEDKEKAATRAATQWLGEVDAGKYGQSWQDASSWVKSRSSQEQWENMLNSTRAPRGAVVSRKLAATHYVQSHSGGMGDSVSVQFDTSFEHNKSASKSASENVAVTLDKDGQWRVMGYSIN